jgi:hypothetical protein
MGSRLQFISISIEYLQQNGWLPKPGYFMNCCHETTKMDVPPGNRRVLIPRRT